MRQMATMQKGQRGITLVSLLIIVAVVAFFAMMAVRLFPVYMEHFSVVSSLKSLGDDQESKGKAPSELRNHLMRRFEINDVRSVSPDDITISRDGSVNTINIVYDVTVPFLYNIDFTVHFDDTVKVNDR